MLPTRWLTMAVLAAVLVAMLVSTATQMANATSGTWDETIYMRLGQNCIGLVVLLPLGSCLQEYARRALRPYVIRRARCGETRPRSPLPPCSRSW